MFQDPSNPYKQTASTVLPDAPTEEYHPPEYPPARPPQAGRLVQKNPATTILPAGPLHNRLANLWHRDPAYKVLFIAIGFVLVASIISVAILAALTTQISSSINPVPNAPIRPQPTLAIPPTPQATAAPTPLPTPIPTPTPIAIITPTSIATTPAVIPPNPEQGLAAQIGVLPAQINNGTVLPVTVNTNQPGATVSLFVTYSAIPILFTSNPQIADANGTTTFSLSVHERTFSPFTRMISANITAVVRYQGHRQATSRTVMIHIITR